MYRFNLVLIFIFICYYLNNVNSNHTDSLHIFKCKSNQTYFKYSLSNDLSWIEYLQQIYRINENDSHSIYSLTDIYMKNDYLKTFLKNTNVRVNIIKNVRILGEDNFLITIHGDLVSFRSNQSIPVYRYNNDVLCRYGKYIYYHISLHNVI